METADRHQTRALAVSGHLPPSEAADQQVLTARPSSLAPGAAPAPRGEPGEPGLGQERAGQDTADQQHGRPPDNTTLLLFLASVLIPNIKCRQPTSSLSISCHSSHCWLMHSLSSCVVQCFFLAYPAPEHQISSGSSQFYRPLPGAWSVCR